MKNVVKILMEMNWFIIGLYAYGNVCNSCTIYIVLLVIVVLLLAFVYFYWYLKKDNANTANINANSETLIYWTYKW